MPGGRFLCTALGRAHRYAPLERCTQDAVLGTAHCVRHGGRPGGKAARKRERLADKFSNASLVILNEGGLDVGYLEELGVLRDYEIRDPGEVLLEEVARAASIVQWLEREVEQLTEQELLREEVETSTVENKQSQGTGPGADSYFLDKTERKKQVATLWQLLHEERKLLANVSAAAIKSGIEERRVRLAERQTLALETAVSAALVDLGLDPNSERVRAVLGARMREAIELPASAFSVRTEPERVPAERVPPEPPAEF